MDSSESNIGSNLIQECASKTFDVVIPNPNVKMLTSTIYKVCELDDRGRPRERERRPPGTHRERSRERNLGRSGHQHKSRSPNRPSKTAPPRSSATTTGLIGHSRSRGDHNVDRSRMDDMNRFRSDGDLLKRSLILDRHRQRERETVQQQLQTKLRMDRDNRNREKEAREVDKSGWYLPRKHQDELDRVVKRAREERSSYWNKRVIEAEEKDPNRWGHSGFKELYRRDMKLGGPQPAGRPGSQSPPSTAKHFRGSPERQPQPKRMIPDQRLHQRRTRSRSKSRSPKAKVVKSRNNRPRSLSPPASAQRGSNFVPVGTRPATTSGSGAGNNRPTLLRSKTSTNHLQQESRVDRTRESRSNGGGSSLPKIPNDRHSRVDNSLKLLSRSRLAEGSGKSSEFASSEMVYRSSRADKDQRDRPVHKKDARGQRNDRSAISGSMSRSRTRSSASPPPPKLKRTGGGSNRIESKSKSDAKNKESWSRGTSNKKETSRSHSRSSSSSSSSSEDEDVLQLHADDRRKGRGSSISRSSSSSSDDSKSNSASSRASSKLKKDSGSSSSSSSSDSDSDDESDISGKITMDKRKRPYVSDGDKSGSKTSGKDDKQRAGAKRPSSASTAASSSKAARTSASKGASGSKGKSSSREKEKSTGDSSKGETDSESGSTSDSSDEPRMTLSERFAKLTQMSTDKREFAKPLLAVNEIDTKLKVVKDLRNADVKIYVDGLQGLQNPKPSSSSSGAPKVPPRPKSPTFNYPEGEKRYSSDERRRHFERMERDEPNERPAEWSDARVRFEYYRDRGYFNDRPLNFDEYVKWEQWWYQYRDWLQTEGYFPRMGNPAPAPRGGSYPLGEGHRGQGPRGGEWGHMSSTISSRMRPGPGPGPGAPPPPHGGGGRRVEQVASPMRLAPLSSRPHFMGRSDGEGNHSLCIGRCIDRTPGGSLVVNIRQGSSYGPRGREVGITRVGRNR